MEDSENKGGNHAPNRIGSDKTELFSRVEKPAELREFITFCATPSSERVVKTQKELAEKLKVDEDTLSLWKRLPGFWEAVDDEIWDRQGYEHLPDLLHFLHDQATTPKFSFTGQPSYQDNMKAASLLLKAFLEVRKMREKRKSE